MEQLGFKFNPQIFASELTMEIIRKRPERITLKRVMKPHWITFDDFEGPDWPKFSSRTIHAFEKWSEN